MKKILLCLLLALPCYGQQGFMSPALGLRNVVPEGLVGYWQMDEAGGNAVRDLSGNGNTGYLTNSPTWTNGVVGTSLNFNGMFLSNQFVQIPHATSLSVTSVTICAWVKLNSIDVISALCADYADSYKLSYGLYYNNATKSLYFDFSINGNDVSGYRAVVGTANQIQTNVWLHVVAFVDGTTSKIFLNGVQTGTNGPAGYIYASASAKQIGMLRYNSSLLRPLHGSIDNVRIYNRALSAAEVSKVYQAEKGSYTLPNVTDGLVGWWRLDDGSGSTAADSSSNHNSASLTGSTWTNGTIGNAVSFVGTGYGQIGKKDSELGIPTNGISAVFWFKANTAAGSQYLFGNRGTSGGQYIVYGGGAITTVLLGSAGITTDPVVTNTWIHVATTYNGTTTSIYTNGILANNSALGQVYTPSATAFVFGAKSTDFQFGLNGAIDDVRLYNRALTAAEVKTIYNWRP